MRDRDGRKTCHYIAFILNNVNVLPIENFYKIIFNAIFWKLKSNYFCGEKGMLWALTMQNLTSFTTKLLWLGSIWFWSNMSLDNFYKSFITYWFWKKKSFRHHSLCLVQFHITSLISFHIVSEAICFHAWAGFQFWDKIEKLLSKSDALFILFCCLLLKSTVLCSIYFPKRECTY